MNLLDHFGKVFQSLNVPVVGDPSTFPGALPRNDDLEFGSLGTDTALEEVGEIIRNHAESHADGVRTAGDDGDPEENDRTDPFEGVLLDAWEWLPLPLKGCFLDVLVLQEHADCRGGVLMEQFVP